MQKILLTGASSGIGKEVYNKLLSYDVYAPSSDELNLADIDTINQIDYSKFDTIINCAGVNKGTYLGYENNHHSNQLEQIMINYYGPMMLLKNFLKMAKQVLKDHTGRKIGEIRDSGSNQTIHDHTGRKLGEYRPSGNTTHDHTGRKIGSGNLLTSLLR